MPLKLTPYEPEADLRRRCDESMKKLTRGYSKVPTAEEIRRADEKRNHNWKRDAQRAEKNTCKIVDKVVGLQ